MATCSKNTERWEESVNVQCETEMTLTDERDLTRLTLYAVAERKGVPLNMRQGCAVVAGTWVQKPRAEMLLGASLTFSMTFRVIRVASPETSSWTCAALAIRSAIMPEYFLTIANRRREAIRPSLIITT